MDIKELRNKISGALYGMALGDAFGMPSELWTREKIKEYFGEEGIKDFLDGPQENEIACQYKKGQFTDDTGQALAILDALMEKDFMPDCETAASHLLSWAEKENAFEKNILGPTSKAALSLIKEGKNASPITKKALSNGSSMRIAPVGCLLPSEDKEKLAIYVFEITRATHSSSVAVAGACIIAMAVSSAIENASFSTVINDIYQIEPMGLELGFPVVSAKLSERISLALNIADTSRQDDEYFAKRLYDTIGSSVQIIESVPAAIGIAYYAKEPEKAAILSANLGGDTDTIGAMACGICGAYTGIGKINKKYIKVLKQANNVDFNYYIRLLLEGREKIREIG